MPATDDEPLADVLELRRRDPDDGRARGSR
jgi:hypothetical protein